MGTNAGEVSTTLSGLDYFERLLQGDLPLPTICATIPMSLGSAEYGRVVWQGLASDQLLNPMGSVHAGFAMTLLDSCMSCAVHSTLPAGVSYTTLEVKTNLVKAITLDTGPVSAEGNIIKVGRRVGTAEGRLMDKQGAVYAFGTATCLILGRVTD